MENENNILEHPFVKTIGEGPYKVVGFMSIKTSTTQGTKVVGDTSLTRHPQWKGGAGTCQHCGTAIMNIVVIRNGSGDLHGVGTSCALKSDLPPKEVSLIQLRVRKESKQKRKDLIARKREAIQFAVKNKEEEINALPHPHPYYAEQGKTYLNYLDYVGYLSFDSVASSVYKFLKEKNIVDSV
jgi:hypothetical protein